MFGEKRWTQLSGTRGPCSTDACVTGRAQVSSTGSPGHRHTGSCGGDDGGASDARKVRRPTTPGQAPAESYPNPTRNTDPEPGRAGLGDPQFWPVFQGLLAYETPENTVSCTVKGRYHSQSQLSGKGGKPSDFPNCPLYTCSSAQFQHHVTYRVLLLMLQTSHSEALTEDASVMAKLLGGCVLIWGVVGEVTCNHHSAGTGTQLLILGRILEPSKRSSGELEFHEQCREHVQPLRDTARRNENLKQWLPG